nr:NS2 [Wongorr virus]
MEKAYLVMKVGSTTQVCYVDQPPARSTIIHVKKSCSLRVQDREHSTFFVISAISIEWALDRWPKLVFETVDVMPRFGKIEINGKSVEAEFKFGVATGIVQPYTEESDASDGGEVTLPGITFYRIDGNVREEREKLKGAREERDEIVTKALKEAGATRAVGRAHGLRFDNVAKLEKVATDKEKERAFSRNGFFEPDQKPKSWAEEMEKAETRGSRLGSRSASPFVPVAHARAMTEEKFEVGESYYRLLDRLGSTPETLEMMGEGRQLEPRAEGELGNVVGQVSFQKLHLPTFEIDMKRNTYRFDRFKSTDQAYVTERDGEVRVLPIARE